jgi:hypothetical protein
MKFNKELLKVKYPKLAARGVSNPYVSHGFNISWPLIISHRPSLAERLWHANLFSDQYMEA